MEDPDGDGPVQCGWRAVLHHNTHIHPEPEDPACETTAVISPLGCGADTFWVELQFTATDALGLAAHESIALLPDCDGVLDCRLDLDHDGQVGGGDLGLLLRWWGATTPESWQADLDGNGMDDIVIGAPEYGSSQGAVYVYNGSLAGVSATASATRTGELAGSSGGRFGYTLCGGGDSDGDGHPEVLAGRREVYGLQAKINGRLDPKKPSKAKRAGSKKS